MKKTMKALMFSLAIVIVVLAIWRLILNKRSAPAPMEIPPTAAVDYGSVPPFTFTDQNGKKFGAKDLEGKVWVCGFIFTRCSGPCPLITTKMAEIQNQFKDKANFKLVSFSVDPDYDRPEVLARYAQTTGQMETFGISSPESAKRSTRS